MLIPSPETMTDAPSEGEEDTLPAAQTAEAKAAAAASREKKAAEEAKLRAMMDASDSEGDQPKAPQDDEGDTTMTEAEQVAEETGALDAATGNKA